MSVHTDLFWKVRQHPRSTHELKLKLDRRVFTEAELELILRELNQVKKRAIKRAQQGELI